MSSTRLTKASIDRNTLQVVKLLASTQDRSIAKMLDVIVLDYIQHHPIIDGVIQDLTHEAPRT